MDKLIVEAYHSNETVANQVGNSRFCGNIDNWNNDFQFHVIDNHMFQTKESIWSIIQIGLTWERELIFTLVIVVQGFVPLNFTNMDTTRALYLCHSRIFNFGLLDKHLFCSIQVTNWTGLGTQGIDLYCLFN